MHESSQSKQTNIRSYNIAAEVRLVVAITVLLCMAFGVTGVKIADAAPATLTYSCSTNHCYGRNLWQGNTNGAETSVVVRGMASGDGFVNNEVWVVDPNSDGSENCNTGLGSGSYCWVEAGYTAGGSTNGASEFFFWADVRPCGCGGYHEHDSGNLNPNDYGRTSAIDILHGGSSGCPYSSSTWCASIFGNSDSLIGQSTSNTMHASQILMGQELSGTSGANAPTAHFTFNYWINSSGQPELQTVDGTLDPCLSNVCLPDNPPWSGWVTGQDPKNSSTGGNFYTCTLPALPGNKNPC